jgi:hypothetical protein
MPIRTNSAAIKACAAGKLRTHNELNESQLLLRDIGCFLIAHRGDLDGENTRREIRAPVQGPSQECHW